MSFGSNSYDKVIVASNTIESERFSEGIQIVERPYLPTGQVGIGRPLTNSTPASGELLLLVTRCTASRVEGSAVVMFLARLKEEKQREFLSS